MISQVSLFPLIPLAVGLATAFMASARSRREVVASLTDVPSKTGVRVYRLPQGILPVLMFFAIAFPVGTFLLPSSVVLDARALFNLAAAAASFLFLLSWAYLKLYKIVLSEDTLEYGAFFVSAIDLTKVTKIRYHHVNNGISLKLYVSKKRVGIFEGGVDHFDDFAKSVRLRISPSATAETVGKASFQ